MARTHLYVRLIAVAWLAQADAARPRQRNFAVNRANEFVLAGYQALTASRTAKQNVLAMGVALSQLD
jgi:hypothetical protein